MCKILGAGGRKKGAGGIPKRGTCAGVVGGRRSLPNQQSPTAGRSTVARRPAIAGRATTAHSKRRPAVARRQRAAAWTVGRRGFFLDSFLKKFKALVCSKGLGFLGEGWVYSTPFFEACPYTWKC
jgi:hypothetical protein